MGITDYAQKQLREIVYAELPEAGTEVKQNEPYGTVESVKAVSDLVAAISGTVEGVNAEVQSKPELLNEDPYVKGWLVLVPFNRFIKIHQISQFRLQVRRLHENQPTFHVWVFVQKFGF